MKYIQKFLTITILIIFILFGTVPIVKAKKSISIERNEDALTVVEEKEDNKPICEYKEGEVIITYEQSFWNSKANLSLSSVFDKYMVDETIEFNDIKIDSDNTIRLDNSDSNGKTLAISLIKSNKYTTQELIKIFKDKEWIISVEPNYIIKTTSLTNDIYQNCQWALDNNGQNTGTKDLDINPIYTSSNKEKVIAVLDTGVDYTHEDLKNVMWVNPYSQKDLKGTYGYDFTNNDNDPMDDNGHGTAISGIIAAEANNSSGISGTILGASNIKIMAVKILNDSGGMSDAYTVIRAYNYIYKAQQLGTNIIAINNSWGGYLEVDGEAENRFMNSLNAVIDLIGEKGALSICAAGNESKYLDEKGETIVFNQNLQKNVKCKFFPAGLDSKYIISVAASNENDELAYFSNYGDAVDIAAPGTDIVTTTSTLEGLFDKDEFIPSVYPKKQREEVCQEFWDFEDCKNEDIPFTANYGTLSISNEKSFGNGKKCLKWEFDIPKDFDIDDYSKAPKLSLNKKNDVYGLGSCMVWVEPSKEVFVDHLFFYTMFADGKGNYEADGDSPNMFYGNRCWYHVGREDDDTYTKNQTFSIIAEMIGKDEFDNEMKSGRTIKLSPIWCNPGHHVYYIDDFAIAKNKPKKDILKPYILANGTSLSAPFVTGAVGTLSNLYEEDNSIQLKDRVLSCTRKTSKLEGQVVKGGTLDLSQLGKTSPEEPSSNIPVQGIKLDKTKLNLSIGEKVKLEPIIYPENASNKNVLWFSSNYNIVSVDGGELEAKAEGLVGIFAETEDGNYYAKCEVTVSKPVDISKCKIEGIIPKYYTGKKVKLDLTITDGNNKLVENKDYKVSYKNNINEGNATVVITGINHYNGKVIKTFKIIRKPNISAKIDYYITSAYSKGRALDLKDKSAKVGNNIVLTTLSCGKTQRYRINQNEDGSYYIQNVESQKYLGINDNYTGKAKTKVTLTNSNKNSGAKWYIAQNSDSTLSFYTKDGLALESLENNNTSIQINTSNSSSLQKFVTTKKDDVSTANINTGKIYYIVSAIDNKKAIDVYAAGKSDFTNVDIYDLNKTNAQKFKFKKNSDGSYTIINSGSNKAIDVAENKTSNMTNVDIYTQNNTTAQKWYAIKNLDGTITFLGAESGKALDLYAANTNNFNNINIWDWNQTNAQKWKLIN